MENRIEQLKIKLTQYSSGGGCGCKISPTSLDKIIEQLKDESVDHNLLVDQKKSDDASALDLGNGMALIATTDFFMPIVDDAYLFGKIAAANSISDIYAMGGKPIMALAILGWPLEKLPDYLAADVIRGAQEVCKKVGITISGGHTIESPEPFFGLAVNGIVAIENLKKNSTATEGDLLMLTKPLGIGILSSAIKKERILREELDSFETTITQINYIGATLGKLKSVHAMTDVTGFGLLGHTIEMASGANLSVALNYNEIRILPGVQFYIKQKVVPDATYRNWNSYSEKVSFENGVNVMEAFNLLPDPQTNGGLLIAVDPNALEEIQELFKQHNLQDFIEPIGKFIAKEEKTVLVKY